MALDLLLDPAGLPVEAALVLCCATNSATPARTAAASELAPRVRSWELVADIAKRHAVLPLVYRYLKLECPAAVAQEGLAKLRTLWQLIILYIRHLTAELVRLMGIL